MAVLLSVSELHVRAVDDLQEIRKAIDVIIDESINQNIAIEELVRRSGSSGLKKVRERTDATVPSMIESIFGFSMMQTHDHTNHDRKLGVGELDVNMNGVAFRTRHNDYNIQSKSKTSGDYGAVDDIEFPDVPPEVLKKKTLDDQVTEMKEWFKAFRDRNSKDRDYFKYFTPVLCYMEGAWTLQDDDIIEDQLHGKKFKQSAASFRELQMENIFDSESGHMDFNENFAYLPTRLFRVNNKPLISQWNYRILCHKLDYKEIDTNNFKIIDDFHIRFKDNNSLFEDEITKLARFRLSVDRSGKDIEGEFVHGLLDKLMEKIPGMDNYVAKFMNDDTHNVQANHPVTNKPIDASKYHRWYRVTEAGAMGDFMRHKGFNDNHIFMAKTTQKKVLPWFLENMCAVDKKSGKRKCRYSDTQRWTYALPLEIVFLSPLTKWNPHKIQKVDDKTATAGGRSGGTSKTRAFAGYSPSNHYLTPISFYKEAPYDSVAGVLDGEGNVVDAVAAGTPIFTPEIEGVGKVRLRYPIVNLADDGEIAMRELEAVKDFFLNQDKFAKLRREMNAKLRRENDPDVNLQEGWYRLPDGANDHNHQFMVTAEDIKAFATYKQINVQTSPMMKHSHKVTLQMTDTGFKTVACDDKPGPCNGHASNNYRIDMI